MDADNIERLSVPPDNLEEFTAFVAREIEIPPEEIGSTEIVRKIYQLGYRQALDSRKKAR
jgi:hypothetical protein